jgi:hypothetical protein
MKPTTSSRHNHKNQQQRVQEQQSVICFSKSPLLTVYLHHIRIWLKKENDSDESIIAFLIEQYGNQYVLNSIIQRLLGK